MKRFLSGLLAASFVAASALPLGAAPIYMPKSATPASAETNVEQVQYSPKWRLRHGDRRFDRMERRHSRAAERDFYRNGDNYYYKGYRGYRHSRHGYREYNGWWFPAGAFIAGALITGAINADRASGSDHVDWCYDHYRSYRASDNTFQPTRGQRKACNSPYN